MKLELYEYTVTGRGSFPIDMLRYDQSWPSTESGDSLAIINSFLRRRGYNLEYSVTLTSIAEPTEGRWESFGFKASGIRKKL